VAYPEAGPAGGTVEGIAGVSGEDLVRERHYGGGFEFDAVAGELSRSLDFFNVPELEKSQVLAAFAAHKSEVTEGSLAKAAR